MKGLAKYINDITKELSTEILGKEYQGRLMNKLRVNNYLIKEHDRFPKIHFNETLCESFRHQKEKIDTIVYEALMSVED